MKKIPTLFRRDYSARPPTLIDWVTPECWWVPRGEGVATRKFDGNCCLVRHGILYKRHELRRGKKMPVGFEVADIDATTGDVFGWVPVGSGPEDKWHRAAFGPDLPDGTYELIGPKIRGNPEGLPEHVLMAHSDAERLPDCPTTFDGLRAWLTARNIEGVVWHHPDGRRAKIKGRDFGIKRQALP